MPYELQEPTIKELFEDIETHIGDDLPRHKRKAILAVLNDRAMPPPTRTQLENFGNSLKALEKQMGTTMEQAVQLHGTCEEEPGKLMRARRERLMFALSVMKRVEPNFIPRTPGEIEAIARPDAAVNPMKPDPDVAKLRALAGGILDRFMGGEGEHLISDEPITDTQREQVTMAIDLLTSIPGSSHGGDDYCDHVRARACKTIIGYLDPETAKHDLAWAAAGAAS